MAAWKGLVAAEPLAWMRAVRDGMQFSKATKAVAFSLALYAKPDGTNAHPGWKRLAWNSGCGRSTVLAALAELEQCGLLYCVERGSRSGQRDRASNYTLTLHDQLGVLTMPFEYWRKANDPSWTPAGEPMSAEQFLSGF